ncbi:hypothetical protein IJD34_09945 [bacterium]|nr:hypothetical protein [bacterium]
MKTQAINNAIFKASISRNTPSMKLACSYLEKHQNNQPPYANTKTELELFKLIENALEQHPSKEVLYINRHFDDRFFWNERSSINSSQIKLNDVEPIRFDSIAGELGIIRRILDPENKDMFNKLLGVEHSDKYDTWWNKHISPIWNNINRLYRENPEIEPNITDAQYNDCFRKQIDIYDSEYANKKNKDSTLDYDYDYDYVVDVEKEAYATIKVALSIILGTALIIGSLFPRKQNVQQTKEIVTTPIKDSLNKTYQDSLGLTKRFVK